MTSAARRLLVAAPTLLDPNFSHTVVFVVEHTAEGALGVVLNRPTAQPVDEVLSRWAPLAAPPARLFVGGPVQADDALVALGRAAPGTQPVAGPVDESGTWQPLLGAVGSMDLGGAPEDARPAVEAIRAFVGYAGWGPGQLDAEVDDLLTDAPDRLWRRVLRRQGGALAMAANQPADPTVN